MFYCIIFLSGETTFAVRLVLLPPCGFFVCRTRSKMKSMRFTALNFPLQTCNQCVQLPQPLTQLMPSHKSRAGDCLCTCSSPCTIWMARKDPGGGVKPMAIGLELGERIILLVKIRPYTAIPNSFSQECWLCSLCNESQGSFVVPEMEKSPIDLPGPWHLYATCLWFLHS